MSNDKASPPKKIRFNWSIEKLHETNFQVIGIVIRFDLRIAEGVKWAFEEIMRRYRIMNCTIESKNPAVLGAITSNLIWFCHLRFFFFKFAFEVEILVIGFISNRDVQNLLKT